MIISKSYDLEIFPNFFSMSIIDMASYLTMFKDCVKIGPKGKPYPVPLTQCLTVAEIEDRLSRVKKDSFYITDTDDSQLFSMVAFINNMMAYTNEKNDLVRTDMFGYNTSRYDKLMMAAFLMYFGQTNSVKELITKLYNTSKTIIELQNDKNASFEDYFLNNLKRYNLPYKDVDVMQIFALNKCGKGVDKVTGKAIYFPKSLKQTSINLQWYQLLEHELPPICEKDYKLYWSDLRYKGIDANGLNLLIENFDRYVLPEYIEDTMRYNDNDTFIVCEMIRLYIDEIRLRYSITNGYKVDVLNSSRSDMATKLFTKFYSEFSGLQPKQWQKQSTERTAMAFKRVILPNIVFKTPVMQELLKDMMKVVVYSVNKDSFTRVVRLGKMDYTIATGGLHSKDTPRELRSNPIEKVPLTEVSSTGKVVQIKSKGPIDAEWSNLTEDSYIYIHWDIASFYPWLMFMYRIAPAHLNEGVMVRLVEWLARTRVSAKHSKEDLIDGIPRAVFVDALKIVINSLYGKLGYEFGDLYDRLAVLKVTINGQLMIMMLCEDLEMNGIEVASANTDGIVVKLYKRDKAKFESIADAWKKVTKLEADGEEYEAYVNRDINNYAVKEFNGKFTYKGALHPTMYANDLSKGYNMPVVASAVVNYFFYDIPILTSLYNCRNILDFCKTQNVGRQFHVELTVNGENVILQRNVRFYVSNKGGVLEKVNNAAKTRSGLAAGKKVTVLNTLDDKSIEFRNINYTYYYEECMNIINPIKLGISPSQKGDKDNKTVSGKSLIKKYGGQFNTLFDDNEE